MSFARIAAVARRIVQQFIRDRRTLALVFLVPVAVILLLGYILRTAEGRTEVAVIDQSVPSPSSPPVARLLRDFLARGDISVRDMSPEDAENAVREGDIDGIVVVSGDFGPQPGPGDEPQIELTLEGSNPQTSERLSRLLEQAATLLGQELPGMAERRAPPVPLDTAYVYAGPEFDTVDFEAPVLVGFFAFFFVFLLTVVSFLRERTTGTLERIMVTPAGRAELLLGYMIGFGIFAVLQSLVIVLVAVFILRINYEGNLLLIFVMTGILSLGAVNLGIFLSTFARTELQAVQFIPVVIVPQGLLSGVIWPVDTLPRWLEGVARALPLTYANSALRNIMLKGEGVAESGVYGNLAVLVAFAAAFLVLGSLTLRQRLD
jgi:ABC-2 type transport system permease protein